MENIKDKNNLIVNRRAVSIALAIFILMSVFFFIAGFFWGYRQASADVQASINKISFTDQINYTANQPQIDPDATNILVTETEDSALVKDTPVTMVMVTDAMTTDQPSDQKYYAELIGFGHLKPAQTFVSKLQKMGYPVIIRKRVSKNGSGKTVNWYQAITENFADRAALIKLVDAIKKTEHLQGIKIKTA